MIEYSTLLPVGEVERRTAVSHDELRAWESQFGFPHSHADDDGHVFYPEGEVPRLRLIGFLVHSGEIAAGLMDMSDSALADRAGDLRHDLERETVPVDALAVADCMHMIVSNSCNDLEARMRSHIIAHGLSAFVCQVAAPLCQAVGTAWETGRLSVFQENIFAELLERTLSLAGLSLFQPGGARHAGSKPSVLLATPPGEDHRLGIAMVEALLRLEGCDCTRIGTHASAGAILAAMHAHQCDIVAISFSSWYPPARTADTLNVLRAGLEREREIWAGGCNNGLHAAQPPGVRTFARLDALPGAVADWRAARYQTLPVSFRKWRTERRTAAAALA